MKKLLKKAKKGFTLVELVVVIAIIAILSAASVATYFGVTESARKSNVGSTASQIGQLVYLASIDGDDSDLVTTKDGYVVFLKASDGGKLVNTTSETEAKASLVALLSNNSLTVAKEELTLAYKGEEEKVTVKSITYTSSTYNYKATINFGAEAGGAYSVTATEKVSK